MAFACACVAPQLGAFQSAHPDITLELLPTDAAVDLLASGIDLAIRLGPAPQEAFVATRLMRTRYRVCAAPAFLMRHGRPAQPAALAKLSCLRFTLPDFLDRWRFRAPDGEPFEVAVSGRLLVSNALALREAARDRLGALLLADWMIEPDLAAGQLVDLFPDHDCAAASFDTGGWALYPSKAWPPRKVRVMIDFLRARLPRAA